MSEKKLVFIDIDGTLFDNERNLIHDSTIEAIKKMKANNVYVCIASGRSSEMAGEVLDKYGLSFDGYVLINGQIVVLNDEVVFKNPLKPTFIVEFVEECHRHDVPYGFLSNAGAMVSSHHPMVVKSFSDFKMQLPEITDVLKHDGDVYQGLFFNMEYFQYFSDMFKDEVAFIPWMVNDGADIIPKGSSKAIGMEIIREHLGVKRENVYAVGDSTNDIEMIEYAEVGIAMGNAKPDLKEVSDYVTGHIKEDGLYHALKKYQLF